MSAAIIWDVDGTLVDTAELHFQAWAAIAKEHGQPFTRGDFAATFGRRNPEIIQQLFGDRFAGPAMNDLADRKEQLYRDEAAKGTDLLPGVRSLLIGLHEAGYKQAIGSSAPRANLDLILRLSGVERFFDAIIASEDTQRGKPDPQVFLLAAERLGVEPSRCLVMEDAVAGVQAAKAGGMKCVAVRFVGHHTAEKLQAAGADRIVDSLAQLSIQDVRDLLG